MLVLFHPEARAELVQAAEWYERRQSTLGETLWAEVFQALDAMAEAPERWPPWPGMHHSPPIRRLLLREFPFSLPYLALEEHVAVLAVAHMRRKPGYWLRRVRSLPSLPRHSGTTGPKRRAGG